jgi:hypothetical protein
VKDLNLWLAFAAFHAGDYQRANDVSQTIVDLLKFEQMSSLDSYTYLSNLRSLLECTERILKINILNIRKDVLSLTDELF